MEELFGAAYEKNSVIFEQGQAGGEMYIIQSGAVEISKRAGGADEVLAILGKGDFFGEMALLNNEPRSATAKTIQRSRLIAITRQSLLERGKKDPSVFLHIILALIKKMKSARAATQTMAGKIIMYAEAEEPLQKSAAAAAQAGEQSEPSGHEEAAAWSPESMVTFKPGDVIFSQGDPGHEMYIILQGSVCIYRGSGEDRQELFCWGPGEFFGEMAIISDAPRSAAAVASSGALLVRLDRAELDDMIRTRPEVALHIIRTLIRRLQERQSLFEDPRKQLETAERIWRPVLKKKKIKISMVALSTCAGCVSVLLDDRLLEQLFKYTKIVYCPILMDAEEIAECDVAIVEGLVRLQDDVEVLRETRMKSRYLVAWGTCAAYGGLPAEANRFEPEELIAETYGKTADAFSYYLSGTAGVDPEAAFHAQAGVSLTRQASRLGAFERVDYSIAGCPPNPELLLLLVKELIGEQPFKSKPIVCADCPRKPSRDAVSGLSLSPPPGADPGLCLTSMGVACSGFLTRGGCGAPCTASGLPCWGCRGPSLPVMKKLAEGETVQELFARGLSQRCGVQEQDAAERLRAFRRQGLSLYAMDHGMAANFERCK